MRGRVEQNRSGSVAGISHEGSSNATRGITHQHKGADPALAQLLQSLDLGRFLPQFVDEEMDMEAFGVTAYDMATHSCSLTS